jgi:predicted nuclease with TOPRIM domain
MPLINFQPNPKIPPIGFFQPISTDPKDMMTDVEYLLGILKKLNEVIKQVNSNTEFIEHYAGKIEELESEIADLRAEMTAFETEVNQNITQRFAEIKSELQAMIAVTLIQANAYTDSVAERLEEEIRNISIGEIVAFDPTTGMYSPLQVIIDNLYNSSREDALTASEYDGLELTATDYDGYELTATAYDQHAKSLLV